VISDRSNATKCTETQGKWCKNKHGASKIIDTFETYHGSDLQHLGPRVVTSGYRSWSLQREGKDSSPFFLYLYFTILTDLYCLVVVCMSLCVVLIVPFLKKIL
jgi:hypothetical protein